MVRVMMGQTDEEFLEEHHLIFVNLVNMAIEKGEIAESMKNHLLTLPFTDLDELDQCYQDLIHALENKDYYKTIDSIERGEVLLERTTDPTERERFKNRLADLTKQLEEMNKPS